MVVRIEVDYVVFVVDLKSEGVCILRMVDLLLLSEFIGLEEEVE